MNTPDLSSGTAAGDRISIVLVGTQHPGNIGAVARAMKNMGLVELHLVRPKFFPNADATARASVSKRERMSGSEAMCGAITFNATSRPSRVSRAR